MKMRNVIMVLMAVLMAAVSLTACAKANYMTEGEKLVEVQNTTLNANPSLEDGYDFSNDVVPGVGLEMSSSYVTEYRVKMSLNKVRFFPSEFSNPSFSEGWSALVSKKSPPGVFMDKYSSNKGRKNTGVSALIFFNDVKWQGHTVFTSAYVDFYCLKKFHFFKGFVGKGWEIDSHFTSDIEFSVPEEYWRFLSAYSAIGADIGNINVFVIWDGGSSSGYTTYKGCSLSLGKSVEYELYTEEVSADTKDPSSPKFKLGSIAGILAGVSKDRSGLPTWVVVLIVIGVILLVLILLGIIVKLFRK